MTETGEERTLANDWVFAMTGFQPNREFLGRCGVEIDEATRQPVVDPMTLESNVPGIFCAGVIVGGNISGMIFIENARYHGQVVVERIVELSR
jgi:thioredoxin reductase (NADPH)